MSNPLIQMSNPLIQSPIYKEPWTVQNVDAQDLVLSSKLFVADCAVVYDLEYKRKYIYWQNIHDTAHDNLLWVLFNIIYFLLFYVTYYYKHLDCSVLDLQVQEVAGSIPSHVIPKTL